MNNSFEELKGTICNKPLLDKTPIGRTRAIFIIVVNGSYNAQEYIPCIAWGNNADYIGGKSTGDLVRLHGYYASRVYVANGKSEEISEFVVRDASV